MCRQRPKNCVRAAAVAARVFPRTRIHASTSGPINDLAEDLDRAGDDLPRIRRLHGRPIVGRPAAGPSIGVRAAPPLVRELPEISGRIRGNGEARTPRSRTRTPSSRRRDRRNWCRRFSAPKGVAAVAGNVREAVTCAFVRHPKPHGIGTPWYFDRAAGSEQRVRTYRDAIRLHVWSYAHFPLYFGIVVVGVGIQRIVTAASHDTVSSHERGILVMAAAAPVIAMATISRTTDRRLEMQRCPTDRDTEVFA